MLLLCKCVLYSCWWMTAWPSHRFTCCWGNTTRHRGRMTPLPVRSPRERSFLRDQPLLKRSAIHSSCHFVNMHASLPFHCFPYVIVVSPDLHFVLYWFDVCSCCTLQLTCFLQPRSCAQCLSNLCSSPTRAGTTPFLSSMYWQSLKKKKKKSARSWLGNSWPDVLRHLCTDLSVIVCCDGGM